MMILKYSYLDEENGIVKSLDRVTGKFGVYHLPSETVIVEPRYDYIYPFSDCRAVVKNNGFCFEIDRAGKEFYDLYQTIEEFEGDVEIIDKGDTCPDCEGNGCGTCVGLGFLFPDVDSYLD